MQMVCLQQCHERACRLRVGGARGTALFVHLCVRMHIRQWRACTLVRSRDSDFRKCRSDSVAVNRSDTSGSWQWACWLQGGVLERPRGSGKLAIQRSDDRALWW